MKNYLLLAVHCSKQLNQMRVRSDLDSPARAGKMLSDYRVEVGKSLILLNILRNDLKNKNLKRARLIKERVYMLLTNAIASHCYFVPERSNPLSRVSLHTMRNEKGRIPTTDEIIKHRKQIFRDAAAGIDSNLKFSDSSNDDFHSSQKIFLIFIAGIVLVIICLLGNLLFSFLK